MKIAVCLSRQVRTGADVFFSLKNYIGELWDNCDFFMHTWDIETTSPHIPQLENTSGVNPIDYEALESLLDTYDDRAFDINNRDKYGNTLLLLACQQGGISKRICKLLLRRGADINAQNYMGNTALHYLMTYNQSPALAEYMIQRGADDSLLNYDGLTCYEGLSKEDVDDME